MATLEEISDLLKALSDPTRLKIYKLLNESDTMLCVNALAANLKITQSAVSQHLKILRQAGLVRSERRGYFIHYKTNRSQLEYVTKLLHETFLKD